MVNDRGHAFEDGGFTCHCRLTTEGRIDNKYMPNVLECECFTESGNQWSRLDLNKRLWNRDGYLGCFSAKGVDAGHDWDY